uniref:V-type proton ATPase subunit a n=1 Tax=Angiostrongylus cantonensis TaxID=6313 RepID=A0A158PBN9_ANGCA
MGSLYRSEPMKLCEMILVKDVAYNCVGELGKYGNVQFNDLNANKNIFQRTFVREVRRCEELERKLRFLERQVVECVQGIELLPIDATIIETPSHYEINHLETELGELERDFVELNKNDSYIRKNLNEMREFEYVLQRVEQFFEVVRRLIIFLSPVLLFHRRCNSYSLIQTLRLFKQDGLPKSVSSGGLICSQNDVPLTPLLNDEKGDNAWFVAGVIPLDKKNTFERILWRACRRTAFVRMSDITLTLEDPVTLAPIVKCVFIVFFKGESLKLIIDKVCDGFNARQYPCPKTSKERRSALFETIARIHDLKIVIDSTQKHRFEILTEVAKDLPLWFKKVHLQKAIYSTLNMFTVDTNGFLAAQCWIPENEMDTVHFALHEGIVRFAWEFPLKASGCDVSPILNVITPLASPPTHHRTNKFTSVFQSIVDSYGVARLFFILNEKKIVERKVRDERGPYPFGVDPIWNIADNRLAFLNSMKMKISVIIGVLQMTFGVFLSLLNHIFFNSNVDVLTNFIPQVVFLGCIFIYLCVQMIAKWLLFSVEKGSVLGMDYPGSYCAPSLLIGLINMLMLKERPVGYMTEQNGTTHHQTCYLNQWYPDQDDSEHLVAIDRYLSEHSLLDEFVHQAILTIEFVLGCVSHTASYLRLWALSLAHAQLSEVLWHMVLIRGLSSQGSLFTTSLITYVMFFFFAVMSLTILVMMEGLSAFLHALRLHWVEFQSKFYQGYGHAFRPFSLQDCLETAQHLPEITEDL